MFKQLSRAVRAAIRQHRRSQETRFVYSKNKKSFFLDINSYLANCVLSIQLISHGSVLRNHDATNILLRGFLANFSSLFHQANGLAQGNHN